jgi:hypothetical protein
MNRMPEWKFIAVAGITLIVSLMMLPKRCQAQQAGQIQTVPEAGIRTASAAVDSLKEEVHSQQGFRPKRALCRYARVAPQLH